MCGQLALAEEALAPLGEEIARRLRAGPYLQFDDTSVLVQAEEDKARFYGKMWTYHSPLERLVAFDATETREHVGPLHFLEGFQGYLQGDAYSGNLTLRNKSPVFMVGCMAHLRRYFVVALEKDPRAAHFIAVIKKLYEIEEEARGLGHDERRALRQKRAAPLLRELMRLARVMGPSVLPKSPLGEALTYLRNQMRYVAQYIRDGRLEIDNNGAERQLRGVAVGRKNWLFAGSMKGLHRAALLYSLVQSAKLAELVAVAEIGDLAPQLVVGIGVQQVEAGSGGTREHVLADAHQQRALQRPYPVLAEARHVELNDGPRTAIRRRKRFVAARADVPVETRLAVAQDRGGAVAGGRAERMVEPGAIAGGDQDFRV